MESNPNDSSALSDSWKLIVLNFFESTFHDELCDSLNDGWFFIEKPNLTISSKILINVVKNALKFVPTKQTAELTHSQVSQFWSDNLQVED